MKYTPSLVFCYPCMDMLQLFQTGGKVMVIRCDKTFLGECGGILWF